MYYAFSKNFFEHIIFAKFARRESENVQTKNTELKKMGKWENGKMGRACWARGATCRTRGAIGQTRGVE